MKLRKQIKKCEKYSGSPIGDLPWEVRRAFPHIDICSSGIAFDEDGDFLTIDEAIDVLNILIDQLS